MCPEAVVLGRLPGAQRSLRCIGKGCEPAEERKMAQMAICTDL